MFVESHNSEQHAAAREYLAVVSEYLQEIHQSFDGVLCFENSLPRSFVLKCRNKIELQFLEINRTRQHRSLKKHLLILSGLECVP